MHFQIHHQNITILVVIGQHQVRPILFEEPMREDIMIGEEIDHENMEDKNGTDIMIMIVVEPIRTLPVHHRHPREM